MKLKGDAVPTISKKIRRITRSDVTVFSWKTYCFYCGPPCVPDPKYLNVKKSVASVHCLSSRVLVIKEMINGHRK